MAFTGKYKLESYDNYNKFMSGSGLPKEIVEKYKDAEYLLEVEQNEDNFTWTKIFNHKNTEREVIVNKYTIGEPCVIQSVLGITIKTTIHMDDGKIWTRYPMFYYTAELEGDNLIEMNYFDGPTGKATLKGTFKRV